LLAVDAVCRAGADVVRASNQRCMIASADNIDSGPGATNQNVVFDNQQRRIGGICEYSYSLPCIAFDGAVRHLDNRALTDHQVRGLNGARGRYSLDICARDHHCFAVKREQHNRRKARLHPGDVTPASDRRDSDVPVKRDCVPSGHHITVAYKNPLWDVGSRAFRIIDSCRAAAGAKKTAIADRQMVPAPLKPAERIPRHAPAINEPCTASVRSIGGAVAVVGATPINMNVFSVAGVLKVAASSPRHITHCSAVHARVKDPIEAGVDLLGDCR